MIEHEIFDYIKHQYDVTTFEICFNIEVDVFFDLGEIGGGAADQSAGGVSAQLYHNAEVSKPDPSAGPVNVVGVQRAVCLHSVKQDDSRGSAGPQSL